MINALQKNMDSCYAAPMSVEAQPLDQIEKTVFAAAEESQNHKKGFVEIKDVLAGALDRIDALFQSDDAPEATYYQ